MESRKAITAVTLLALGCDMPDSDMTPEARTELLCAEDILRRTQFTQDCVALTIAYVDENDSLVHGRRILGDTEIAVAEIPISREVSMLQAVRKIERLDLKDDDSPFDEAVCECMQTDDHLANSLRVIKTQCEARSSIAKDTSRLHAEFWLEKTASRDGDNLRQQLSLHYHWPATVGKSTHVVMDSQGCRINGVGRIPRDRCEALFGRGHEVLRETRRRIGQIKPQKIPRR